MAVSLCAHGGLDVETLFKLDLRSGHSTSVRYGVDGDRYALADYPRTAELLAGGGSLHLHAGDPEADPAEVALLIKLGATDVLLAGASDGRGAWLLEIFGDLESADIAPRRRRAAPAVRPRGAPGGRPARRAPGDREPARGAVGAYLSGNAGYRAKGMTARTPGALAALLALAVAAPAAAVPPQPIAGGP